ncbi:nephrocystin-4 [Engraulis encrasicolus]|uniref:nephrocystin-4 n=1 Tax=Engraulis encrasicolus TaxID=184585 RepID=UPI002FD1D744
MTELHGELVSLLGRGEKKGEWLAGRLGNETSPDEESPELAQERKLKRMAAVRDAEHQGGAIHHKTHMWRREERSDWLRSLRVIGAMRDERKRDDITSMLSRSITSRVTLYCPLAAARPLVVKLTNPYGTPHTFKIHTSNPDLSVVCDVREWGELRGRGDVQGVCVLEEGMFRLDDAAVPHVYLRPRETLHIPFKYQTFTTQSVAPVRSHQVVQELPSPSLDVKSIKVSFVGQDDRPVSIVEVRVELLPHVVDQTIRFTHPQNTQLKKAIRLPPTEATDLRVCCNDPDVQCEIISKSPGEPQDVQVKMDGCSSPNIKTFNIIVFTDRWRLVPAQIWQVSVHFLQWMDISCVTGQLTCQSLVLRGTQANRRVRCHVSHPLEIWVDPCEVFALPARAVCELRVFVRCVSSGVKFLQLNVVDEQQHQLVDAWSICVNAQPPAITRTWDVCVPVGGGRGSTKKFSYTNPYTHTHTFTLLTDQPHLLHFKQDSFQVGGGQTYSIGLRFAPSQSCGQQEILIFINNQDQRNQDTFRAQVTYS